MTNADWLVVALCSYMGADPAVSQTQTPPTNPLPFEIGYNGDNVRLELQEA